MWKFSRFQTLCVSPITRLWVSVEYVVHKVEWKFNAAREIKKNFGRLRIILELHFSVVIHGERFPKVELNLSSVEFYEDRPEWSKLAMLNGAVHLRNESISWTIVIFHCQWDECWHEGKLNFWWKIVLEKKKKKNNEIWNFWLNCSIYEFIRENIWILVGF